MPAKTKPAKKRNFPDKVMLVLTIIAAVSILLSLLASVVDPRKFWQLAFFGLAYPPILVANIIMLLYWFIRMSRLLFIPLVSILVGWGILVNTFNISSGDANGPKASENYLRMLTYNVHSFSGVGENEHQSTRSEILKLVSAEQPDVVGMEEFFTRKEGPNDIVDSMKRVLHTNYYYAFMVDNINYQGNGIALFSKYPIINQGLIQLSGKAGTNQCIFIDVKKANHIVRIYAVHLQSIHFMPEDYQLIDSVSKAEESSIHSYKRILSKLKKAFLKRSEQVLIVKKHAQTSPYPYIIAGDFNDTPASFAVNKMSAGLKNAFHQKGNGFGATYNGDFPNYQIDYILVHPKFKVINYQVVRKRLSDHYPVRADLLLQ